MEIIHLEKESFNDLIKQNKILVDFYADWCGPCQMMASVLEEVKNEIQIVKVNVDKFNDISQKYGVMSIPTLILFENGNESTRVVGYRNKDELLNIIK